MSATLPPLAISMGEPAGIGPDLVLELFTNRVALDLPPFVVFGHSGFLRERADRLGLKLEIDAGTAETAGDTFARALPVVDVEGMVHDTPGAPTARSAPHVIAAIDAATRAVLHGVCRGLVTAPIHKAVLIGAGFKYPGHTEYLAALCADGQPPRHPVMMLAHEKFRVVPLTVHVPLRAVPGMITASLLTTTIRTLIHDLRSRFGVGAPRIGVSGLNPHAGEGGSMGSEDLDIIAPAVLGLRQDGFDVVGPLPADTLFHPPHWQSYDAVVAMYHDQALIPIKTVAFETAVNVTLGLPIVRTSPDHGTAFDLAGSGRASSQSFLAALKMADTLTRRSA